MNLFKLFEGSWLLEGSWKKRARSSRALPRRRGEMLFLETLEDRVVPTILFTPQHGVEHATTAGGPVMGTVSWGMPIYTIFWGSYWNTPAGVTYSNNIENALNSMFYTSAYLDGLHQYGVVYRAGVNGSGTVRVFNYTNPNPSGFSGTDVFNVMSNGIHSQGLPHPNDFTNHGVYFVITPPGAFQAGCGCGGYHTVSTVDSQTAEWGWIGTGGSMDSATYILSHETAETMSDPQGNAWQVDPRSGSAWNEICDNEAQSYTYRLNGYQMQAYWSQSALAYQVSDGNAQNFIVNNRQLIVNGDQLANKNDTITIDTSSGGVRVTLNGEVAQFDPGAITSITVNSLTGADVINVLRTLSGVPVTVNSSGAATVNVGVSGSVQSIQGAVTVFNGPTYDTLNVDDSADAGNHTVTISSGGITGLAPAPINFTGGSVGALTVRGGSGTLAYTLSATPAHTSMTLNTGTGVDTVNVQATSVPLAVNGGGGGGADVLNLGNSNSLASIFGAVTIANGPSYFHVTLNDSADGGSHGSVTITNGGITGLAPAAINFSGAAANTLTINGGSGANTYTVNGPQGYLGVTLNAGSGTDTVNVQATSYALAVNGTGGGGNDVVNLGNSNSLAGITAAVTLANASRFHLNVNDAADSTNRSPTIGASGIVGLSSAGINFSSASVNVLTVNAGNGTNNYTVAATPASTSVTLNTGAGTDSVTIQATSVPLAVNGTGGGGNDVVNLGNNNSLAGITGAVTLANASRFHVNVNDAADSTNRSVTISTGGITGLAPAALNFTASSVNVLTVNGGTGNNTYTVSGTPASTSVTLNTGSGTDTVYVLATSVSLAVNGTGGGGNDVVNLGNANRVSGILGAVTLANPSGVQVNVNDAADSANLPNVVISGTGITGLAPAALNFGAASVNLLTISGGTGNSNYFITDTPASQGTTLNTGLGGNFVNVQGNTAPLTINTGSGDALYLSNTSATFDGIGAVTVNDPTGTSQVTVEDSNYGGGDDYLITSSTVTSARSATFALTYSGLGGLTLNGGYVGSTFDIDSTSVPTTINAGTGGNIFHISPFTQYLAASIGGLTLNGGGGDILEFFDAADPNSETFNFDSVPTSLTLGSTGTDITDFYGMGGGVYVVTNGFSTPNDQSGTVIFDPSGGPPSGQGGAAPGGASTREVLPRLLPAWFPAATGTATTAAHPLEAAFHGRGLPGTADYLALLDEVFSA